MNLAGQFTCPVIQYRAGQFSGWTVGPEWSSVRLPTNLMDCPWRFVRIDLQTLWKFSSGGPTKHETVKSTVRNEHQTVMPTVRNEHQTVMPTVRNEHQTVMPTVRNEHQTVMPTYCAHEHQTVMPTVRNKWLYLIPLIYIYIYSIYNYNCLPRNEPLDSKG